MYFDQNKIKKIFEPFFLKRIIGSSSPASQFLYSDRLRMLVCCTMIIFLFSCRKFVEVETPTTSTNAELVFKTDASAIAALNNIYTRMSQQGISLGITSLSLYTSLSSDDLKYFESTNDLQVPPYYSNSLTASNPGAGDFWSNTYGVYIFLCNSAINGLSNNEFLTPKVRDQLLGEALFIRSLCFFYLVNLYGDIPLVLTTDFKTNSNIERTKSSNVYEQIIQDLRRSESLLSGNYLDGTLLRSSIERIAPNSYCAKALLARVFLFSGDYTNAKRYSDSVILNTSLYELSTPEEVFLVNSKESIWQIQSVSSFNTNTSDALEFLAAKISPLTARVYLNENLVNSFSVGDQRRTIWFDSLYLDSKWYYLPAKYKVITPMEPTTERVTVLRLSEQYLIRAEANLKLSDLASAVDDINIIRARAGLEKFNSTSASEIMAEIISQRRFEFFTEWGHRWFDLKRLGLVDGVLSNLKGASWQATDQLFPIPLSEIQENVALVGHQNPGY
ncbi:Starch-binding associating with outer membrane [Chitinophaga sp. YR627]|uniref:RagB/SusD family nutrient uptake outer membrane protein n=1 Tax=Chitinophaga sp. YR627 TaxID=1881041 RepID=UPI0008EA360C|nr:RagB/SusD family nutrient uptake outer membrane protein [Chitinophaga sp. YR627]SFO29639.1 Starch-binding associating with outer membrane [Chitinophaga sp. YR627]